MAISLLTLFLWIFWIPVTCVAWTIVGDPFNRNCDTGGIAFLIAIILTVIWLVWTGCAIYAAAPIMIQYLSTLFT
jgi:hypothetical protein